jgi:hypothetical protein
LKDAKKRLKTNDENLVHVPLMIPIFQCDKKIRVEKGAGQPKGK